MYEATPSRCLYDVHMHTEIRTAQGQHGLETRAVPRLQSEHSSVA